MNTDLCIWGDSIAHGSCDERGGWAHRLRLAREKEGLLTYPLGVSGDTSDCVVARLKPELRARNPKKALFAIGVNDTKYYGDGPCYLSREEFLDNIECIAQLASKEAKVGFVGIARVDETRTQPVSWGQTKYSNKAILEYNAALKTFCEEQDIPFLDVFDLLDDQDLEDGLHPNTRGHKKLFEEIKSFVGSF